MVEPIETLFPSLRNSLFQITSPAARDYNCIAWAAGDTTRWWWPAPDTDVAYWPAGVDLEETLDAFVAAFATLGYAPCADEESEPGYQKVALFAMALVPTHAARQLPSGRWTSKLGLREDIEHDLQAVSGDVYGKVVMLLKRPHSSASSLPRLPSIGT
jgi:hypothetical protein